MEQKSSKTRKDGKALLTAKTPFGSFSRTTNHDYRFVVISCGMNEALLISRFEAFCAHDKKEYARYSAIAQGKAEEGRGLNLGKEWYAETATKLPSVLASHADHLTRNLLASRSALAEKRGVCHGWTSRRDLAEKLVSSLRKEGLHLNLTICAINPTDEERVYLGAEEAAPNRRASRKPAAKLSDRNPLHYLRAEDAL
jgi:hypothetical protein